MIAATFQTTQVTEGNRSTNTASYPDLKTYAIKMSTNAEIGMFKDSLNLVKELKSTIDDGGRLFQTGATRYSDWHLIGHHTA